MTYAILRFPEVLGSATIVRTVCDVATKTGLSGKVNKFLCVRLSLCQTVFVPDCLCARLSLCQTVCVPDCLCGPFLSLWSFFVFVPDCLCGPFLSLCQTVFVVLFCLCARLSLWSLLSLCQTVFVVHLSQDRWPHSLYHDVFVVSLIQNRWLHSLCHVALWSVWSKIDDHILCATLSLWSVWSKIDDHISVPCCFVVSLIQNRWPHSLCHVALWSVWSKIDDHVVCQCLCVSLSWDRWIFFVS